jgi:Zn-dependent peptidase ImmA (M78 family)/DNA-binding XRE family transcriptional regulator
MALDLQLLGEKLKGYRDQFQLSCEEVSKATGIDAETLANFERGERSPTGDQILILADFYKCDYKFFLSNERLAPFEQTKTLFRRFGEEFSKQDRWAVQEFLFLAEVESYLQSALSKEEAKEFSFKKTGTFLKGHGQQAAAALRQLLGYPDNQVPRNIYEDFRSIGIHIFRRRLDSSNISGLCVRHPVAGKCVLVNYSEDVYRQRFTAAHEAAHAILDEEEDVIVSFARQEKDLREVRANTFASHYLVPPAFLRYLPNPSKWNSTDAIHWANELRVNTETLSIALSEARLIDSAAQERIRSFRVPKEMKQDPELSETLSPRAKERKEELLKRGLSDYYVGLCFEAYRQKIVSAARLIEILLLDGDTELRELAQLYNETLHYGD